MSRFGLECYQRIEHALGKQLESYEVEKEEVMMFKLRVEEAQIEARNEMRAQDERDKKRKGRRHENDPKRAKKRADNMDAEER